MLNFLWKGKLKSLILILFSTLIGRIWEVYDALLNIIFCGLYIWNTTLIQRDGSFRYPYNDGEAVLGAMLLLQYLPRLVIWYNVISPMSLLTMISTLPPLITLFHHEWVEGPLLYIYPVRFMRMHLAVMQILVPSKTSILKLSLITRKAIRLIGIIVFLILTVAAVVHIVEVKAQGSKITFFDAFFFTLVSPTSGLSSQIVPDNIFSRLVIIYIMVSGALFLPTNVAELLSLLSKKSVYDHSFKPTHRNHVLLCGTLDVSSIASFLEEFFCSDHGTMTVNTHVVILNASEPSEELSLILTHPKYAARVQYVKGTPVHKRGLEKVRIQDAKACFLLSSKRETSQVSILDAETVMQCMV